MQTNIKHSIQEYCKKINRAITPVFIISLFLSFLAFFSLTLYVYEKQKGERKSIVYEEKKSDPEDRRGTSDASKPFGSIKGKTYTFSWCQGSGTISLKNKIIFSSEEEAKKTGRTLSKLCKR